MRLVALAATIASLALPLPTLVAAEGTYTATSFCAWDDAILDVVIVVPVAPVGVHHDGGTIDVLAPALVPSADAAAPWDAAHARAAVAAVDAWSSALGALSADPRYAHLAAVELRTTLTGPDADANIVEGADVVVSFTPVQDAGGRTVMSCTSATDQDVGEEAIRLGLGTWIVMNQWFVFHFTPTDTYNIMLHEFGHALGLEHIDDAPGDIMNSVYPHAVGNVQNPRECLSNLDVLQVAAGFAWLDGVTPYSSDPPATTLAQSAYARPC